jgi:very-short-patch-repair endonuclease
LLGLIEYDGEQHFRPVEAWGGEEKFILQKERDMRKDAYCEEKGVRLLRIPYTDFNKISLEYLFQKFPELKKYQPSSEI